MAHRRVRSQSLSIVPLFSIHFLLQGALGPRICFINVWHDLLFSFCRSWSPSSRLFFFKLLRGRFLSSRGTFSGSMLTYSPTTLQRTSHTMPLEFGASLTRRSRVHQVPTAFSLFSVLSLSDHHVDHTNCSDKLMVPS